jgi:hypothetical protein
MAKSWRTFALGNLGSKYQARNDYANNEWELSNDGGVTWIPTTGFGQRYLHGTFSDGTELETNNNGKTWQFAKLPPQANPPQQPPHLCEIRIDVNGRYEFTNNGGTTWRKVVNLTTVQPPPAIGQYRFNAPITTTIELTDGSVYESHDGGKTWIMVAPPIPPAPASFSPWQKSSGISWGFTVSGYGNSKHLLKEELAHTLNEIVGRTVYSVDVSNSSTIRIYFDDGSMLLTLRPAWKSDELEADMDYIP